MIRKKNPALLAAYFILCAIAFGIAVFYGEFAKVRVGPLFILEAAFGLWLALALYLRTKKELLSGLKLLWAPALFFGWGILRAGFDVIADRHLIPDQRTWMRFAQHMILFAYPLLWMWVGTWMSRVDRKLARLVILVLFAGNLLLNRITWSVENLSLGPLISVPMIYSLHHLVNSKTKRKTKDWLLVLGLALATFIPFWKMWWVEVMQRTTLLLLITLMTGAAWLASDTKVRLVGSLKTLAAAFSIFLLGISVTTLIPKPGASKQHGISDKFFTAMQKDEDVPYEGNPERFQFRARGFWWKTTISDWSKNRVFGIGFIPEIPSRLADYDPLSVYDPNERFYNTWETVQKYARFRSQAPISGPHNSYLSVLARMGILGALLFAALTFSWIKGIRPLLQPGKLDFVDAFLVLIPVAGALHAIVNVGFESPHNCVLMWLVAGAALERARKLAQGSP